MAYSYSYYAMRDMKLILVSAIALLFPCIRAELVYNEVTAKQFAENVVKEASKKIIEGSHEFSHLRNFNASIPKTGKFIYLFNIGHAV